jgi:choline dehydrogenase-like flavoprotein
MSFKLIDAITATGLEANNDFNAAEQLGAGFYQVTQRRGMRWTTADGYIDPARKRSNFDVLTNTHVLRVRIQNGVAVGVEAERDGQAGFIRATKEVIVSAGAINTPQLLMLSGIGPADHLAEHGIPVIVDNPNVGDHYMDHTIMASAPTPPPPWPSAAPWSERKARATSGCEAATRRTCRPSPPTTSRSPRTCRR